MKKIGFIIPDGTGIRNYLFSNIIPIINNKEIQIVLFHSISDLALEEIKTVHSINFETYKIPTFNETIYQKFLREVVCYARLLHNKELVNNESILTNWNPSKKTFQKSLFYKLIEIVSKRIYNDYSKILKLEIKLNKSYEKKNRFYLKLLTKVKPSLLFSTHQRAMNAIPLVSAAKQLKIKTIGAIFSWDNLPKARLTVKTDEYIVWSKYMNEELQLYYPEIDSKNITITGTPQFEFYTNSNYIMDKDFFYKKFSLDASKKTLCFSGDDLRTSPFDPNYLEDLAEIIQTEALNFQLLLRRAPVDTSGRFDAVISKYPDIIKKVSPLWNFDRDDASNWQVIYPKYEDIELLISTAYYCDAVVNVGSTMAHDFAMFKKPAIYINYNTVNSSSWDIETIYKFQHFKSIENLNPVLWLNSKQEIKETLLIIDLELKLDNEKWLNIIAEHRKTASVNIANTLISCI